MGLFDKCQRCVQRISTKHDARRDFSVEFDNIVKLFSGIVGGLCIFLLGMQYMSDGMQAIAGHRLRKMIAKLTGTPVVACMTGTAVTCLIQSSSVTAVMAITMVNAGLMTLKQSIGVLLGADLGTTITAWIVALKVTKYGLPILGVAGFFYLFSKRERIRFTAMTIMGTGMVFYGLLVMKTGLEPLSHSDDFIIWFSRFSPDTYVGLFKCVLVGSFVTAIMQSSSATIAITILLAVEGVITFETSVALVLGQNIGTTITAYLAALGTSTMAKRTAYAHILIKVIGVMIVFPLFYIYLDIIGWLMPTALIGDIGKQIAFSHTLFNVFIVMLFLPLVGLLVLLLQKMVPTKRTKETPHLTFLDLGLIETPIMAIQQSANEVMTMRDGVNKMMDWLKIEIESPGKSPKDGQKLMHREEVLDMIQKEIVEFISKIMARDVPENIVAEARSQLRTADEYESISDYIVTIMKLLRKLRKVEKGAHKKDLKNILELHDKVSRYLLMVGEALQAENRDAMARARTEGQDILFFYKQCRDEHLEHIEQDSVSPAHTLIISDILQSYRKIEGHALNVAEAVAREK